MCLNPPKGRPVFATITRTRPDEGECLNPPKGRPVFATKTEKLPHDLTEDCLNPPKGRPVFATRIVIPRWDHLKKCLNPPKGRPVFATRTVFILSMQKVTLSSQSPEGSTGLCDVEKVRECVCVPLQCLNPPKGRPVFATWRSVQRATSCPCTSVSIPRRVDRSLRQRARLSQCPKSECLNPPKGRPVFATDCDVGTT